MFENEWITTIEALREAVKARDELNAALLEDIVGLRKKLTAFEAYVSRLTIRGWPERKEL